MALIFERIQTNGIAELSGWTQQTVEKWGDLGKVLLPDLLHVPRRAFEPTGLGQRSS